ncbi:DUF4260 family protein [Microbacterium esteraromaticum]|uniref:DUF4260 family protein n=1 Tax=Microbacterium esteraromaticum TaxID=57043 RepID=UPI0019D3D8B6|nr:DUF4260 family protein [Microbacterium esteraromaticum]MBN7793163.1 DUF4260 family protein [Microbacterium esteraromaticum]
MVIRILWGILAAAAITLSVISSVDYGWIVGGPVIAFALLPDVALIGAFDPTRSGALRPDRVVGYNMLHLARFPVLLIAGGSLITLPVVGGAPGGAVVVGMGLAWLAHIAVDRAVGYGLRDRDGYIRSVAGTPTPGACQA